MSRKPRILIVEDERISAEDLRVTLEGSGFEVAAMASTGESALAQADVLRPDLVLMDIVLQGPLNGIDAAVELRRVHDLPVIYITAYSDPDTVERIKESEPYGYIHKPFDFRELQIVIETALVKHRMERKLREREEWFSTTLKSIGDGVIAADPEGIVTFMNRTAESITGWTLEEARGAPVERVFQIINDQTKRGMENPVRRVLREGRVTGLTNHTVLIRKDGGSVFIDDSGAPILNSRGEITGVVLVFKDITEKKRIERTLFASERRYRQLVETSTDSILLVSPDGAIQFANRRTASMFGYPDPERMRGKSFVTLAAPECRETAGSDLKNLLEEGPPLHGEWTFLGKNGSAFPAEINASLLLDPAGRVQAVTAIIRDISDRRAAMKHINSLSRFPEENPSPVLRIDFRGRILYANPASGELLAFWKSRRGMKIPVKFKKRIDLAVSGKAGKMVDVETGERTYSVNVVPVEGEDYINLYGRDVTLLKQVEALRNQHLHEQTVSAQASKIHMNIRSLGELYESMAAMILKEAGADYLVLCEYDGRLGGLRVHTVKGLEKAGKAAAATIKGHLKREIVPLSKLDSHRMVAYMSRRLIPVNDGLHELTAGRLSGRSGRRIERLLGIQDLWVMGFNCQGQLAGGIALGFRIRAALKNRRLVESIVNQASLMIQHLISEKSLKDRESTSGNNDRTVENCFWVLDQGMGTVDVSIPAAEALGYSKRDLVGRQLSDLLPENEAVRLKRRIRTMGMGKAINLDFTFLRKNGKSIKIRASINRLLGDKAGLNAAFILILKAILPESSLK